MEEKEVSLEKIKNIESVLAVVGKIIEITPIIDDILLATIDCGKEGIWQSFIYKYKDATIAINTKIIVLIASTEDGKKAAAFYDEEIPAELLNSEIGTDVTKIMEKKVLEQEFIDEYTGIRKIIELEKGYQEYLRTIKSKISYYTLKEDK